MKIWPWSKLEELEKRLKDVERHFVTARDPKTGAVAQTLADVPVEKRDALKKGGLHLKGLTWKQKQAILERTDGGRRTQ